MILVEMYINGERTKASHTRHVICANLNYLRDNIAEHGSSQTHNIVIVPVFVSGKDTSMSKNLPDILFKITSSGEQPLSADYLVEQFCASCFRLDELFFQVLIVGRSDAHAVCSHRPKK